VLSVNITIALAIMQQNINVYFTGTNPEAIGGDTSELEARISELEGQVSTLQGQLDQAGTDKETLQNQIDDLNSQITALNTELEGYKNLKYGDVNKDNAVTSADISEVVNVIAGLHNEGGE
jgi:peptidoglycan hydrolase CwlO-like protein